MEPFRLLSVVHVFLIKDGQILLLRRLNTGHHDGDYGLPAGKLDGGEELFSAAIREVREECGAVIAPSDLEMLGAMHIRISGNERIDFFFRAEHWSGEISNTEPDKCDDLRWFPLDDLPENVIPFVQEAWSKFRDGIWFASHGWA
ncbi:NUDIX hydrolase [Paenibacillus sp. IHB B 3415]|uniref:NUDIX hydrolase n=1 Tax=Paenibacillus sp. IHB B 3415 TaxID=867080 RepID=UPI0005744FF9|nr:NUDIX domain-containing protein [Paenibacillus sp. IHB B 3415]KHL97572.1 NUDIX hydrolase [Paenibacillus sp. IHB B 3415]